MNKVLAAILNYNKDHEAREMATSLDCDNYVVDSSGIEKKGFIHTEQAFVSGCYNKAYELFLKSDATHLLIVCSDVKGDLNMVVNNIKFLPKNIGVYSPAVLGQGWPHEKPQFIGLRDVPFCESMITCMRRDIVEYIGKINWVTNKHAYGVDIYAGYVSWLLGYRTVIDDNINVYHPFGTDYDFREGERQMKHYIHSMGNKFETWVRDNKLFIPFHLRIYSKLKRKLFA